MKWKLYKEGDHAIVKRFAYLPTRMDDNYMIWLEYYYDFMGFTKSMGWLSAGKSQDKDYMIFTGVWFDIKTKNRHD